MTLPEGLYDLLVTERLAAQLNLSSSDIHPLKDGGTEFWPKQLLIR